MVVKADGWHRPMTAVQTVEIITFQAPSARNASSADSVDDLSMQMTKETRAVAAVGSFVSGLNRAMLLKTGSSRVPREVAVADIADGLGGESEEELDLEARSAGPSCGVRGSSTDLLGAGSTPLDAADEAPDEAAGVAADMAASEPAVRKDGGLADKRACNATQKASNEAPAVPRRVPVGGPDVGSLEGGKLTLKGKSSAPEGGYSSASVHASLEAANARPLSKKNDGTLRKKTSGAKGPSKKASSSAAATKNRKVRAAMLSGTPPGAAASSRASKDAIAWSGTCGKPRI